MSTLEEELIADEGIKYEIYLDSNGHPTFGIGHLIKEADVEYGRPVGSPVCKRRVDQIFNYDVGKAITDVSVIFGDAASYPEEVWKILVNMSFNLGRTRLSKFVNFIAAIKAHNWTEAAKHGRDSKWWRVDVPNRAERLMKRLENVV